MAKVRADKLREVQDGHDGTWVAHPALIPIAKEVGAPAGLRRLVQRRLGSTLAVLRATPGMAVQRQPSMRRNNPLPPPHPTPTRLQVFDEHMKTPNQIDRQRDDVQPDADALLAVPQGARTEATLRNNIAVCIR